MWVKHKKRLGRGCCVIGMIPIALKTVQVVFRIYHGSRAYSNVINFFSP